MEKALAISDVPNSSSDVFRIRFRARHLGVDNARRAYGHIRKWTGVIDVIMRYTQPPAFARVTPIGYIYQQFFDKRLKLSIQLCFQDNFSSCSLSICFKEAGYAETV